MGKKWDTTLSCRWFMKTDKKKKKNTSIKILQHSVYKELYRMQCTVEEHAVSENGIIWMQVNTISIYDI